MIRYRKNRQGTFEQFLKMAKKTLTGPGLAPETSGLPYHLSYPALWMVAVPNSQLVFAGVGAPVRSN